jgi:alkane 1-monooxygenase
MNMNQNLQNNQLPNPSSDWNEDINSSKKVEESLSSQKTETETVKSPSKEKTTHETKEPFSPKESLIKIIDTIDSITEPKVNLKQYYWAFLPMILAIIGNVFGGYFTLLPLVLFAILIPLDFVVKNKSKVEIKDEKTLSNTILYWVAGLQFAVVTTFLWRLIIVNQWLYGRDFGPWILPAILGNGLVIGLAISSGAHELLHRREQNLKDLGTAQLALVGYGHYTTEHIQGHHRNVGYPGDPSTAVKGQNFYSFLVNALLQEFTDAWKYESSRFQKKNLSPNTMENQVYKWTVYSAIFYVAILIFCGIFGFFSYLLISFIAVGYHAMIVYSQHYGLVKDPDNRVDDTISWQTDSVITENFVLGFGNHSDHHTRVTKTYTEIVQKEEGPLMPCGYFGIIPLALIPSLWFKYFGK